LAGADVRGTLSSNRHIDDDFASFWLAVAEHDYATAQHYGEVPADWIAEADAEPDPLATSEPPEDGPSSGR